MREEENPMTESKGMDRRSFCKGAAAATAAFGALSLAGCAEGNLAETEKAADPGAAFAANEEGAEWVPVSCWHNCGGRCVNKVLVKDGVVLRQKTDDSHEDSWDWPQSRGCIRGRSVQQQVFGADRLKYPMKRKHWEPLTGGDKSLRGCDEWVRIGWDEALDAIANELKNAKEKYGNRSIMYLNEMNLEGYLGGVLSKFGGYVDTTACQSDGVYQYPTTAMLGMGYADLNDRYDIVNSDYFIMWGHNASWCAFGNPSFYVKRFKNAGVKFVVVGPDYNATAGFVDAEWIPCRPGADTALLLGIAHTLITRDENGSLIDWDFLNRCTVGFDADHMPKDAKTDENFIGYVMGEYDGVEKTAEWASEICGTPVEKIHRLAEILGRKNNCYISSAGAPARAKGAENYPQALLTISCMGGHIGKAGNASGLDHNYSTFNRGANLVTLGMGGYAHTMTNAENPVDDIVPYTEMWDAVLTGKYHRAGTTFGECVPAEERDIDIHVVIGEMKNVLQTQSNTNRGIEALRSVDFVCEQAYYMKTGARYADIVLPVATRWEYNTFTFYDMAHDKENVFAHRNIVDLLFESKTDWQIAEELSTRLGFKWSEICPLTDQQMWWNSMVGAVGMEEDGTMKPLFSITQEDIDAYGVEGEPQEGRTPLKQFLADGVYRVKRSEGDSYGHIGYKAFVDDPEGNPLATTSGKFEIYCQAKSDFFDMMKNGIEQYVDVSPLPKFIDQHEGYIDSFADWENKVKGSYPFQMTHIHYLRRAHSDMDNLPWLRESMSNPVFINKEDAEAKGISDGDIIIVRNDNGSFVRPASVTRTVMPGVIIVPHGARATIDKETGIDKSGADNILTSSCKETSPLASGWNSTLVDYEKYTGSIELEPDCEWPLEIPIAE